MASRRIVPSEETVHETIHSKDATPTVSEKSSIAPAVPAFVIVKLLGFTAAMVVGPLGTYFITLNSIFHGNSTWAGATAAIVANVVLIAYVVVAFKDDENERIEAEAQVRKGQ